MSDPDPPPQAPPPGGAAGPSRHLGEFELLEELGRGGMGVVYLARQSSLDRLVALKMLPSFASLDLDAVARFRREAEATGRLHHPGIVPVYGVGEHDGLHWFAMEWVQGPNLEDLLHTLRVRRPERLQQSLVVEAQRAEDFPALVQAPGEPAAACAYVRSCVGLVASVADALATAHDSGVIHRDLKPSNVLLHPAGRPVLVDFGLARDLRADRLTRTGDTVGTPAYMAPEQVLGMQLSDSRMDIYGLGAVLYELLALQPPFRGNTAADLQRAILEGEPEPVHKVNRRVPAVLAAVVHRCLARDPDDRYPAMESLVQELRAFLDCRAMLTRPLGRLDGLRHGFVRRRRLLRNSAMAAMLVAGTVAGVIAWREADRQRRGQELLAEAVQLTRQRLDAGAAAERFAGAQELLGPERAGEVAGARREALRAAFRRFYGDSGLLPLQRLFAALATAADREQLAEECAQLAGQGMIRWAADDGGGEGYRDERPLWVRRVDPAGPLEPWQPVAWGRPLRMGSYLMRVPLGDGGGRVSAPAGAAAGPPGAPLAETASPDPVGVPRDGSHWLRAVRLGRDQTVVLAPELVPDQVPPGSTALFDPALGRSVAIARLEVTAGDYRTWLATLRPELRREMVRPVGAPELAPRQPVVGLSFAQARAFAAHHGAVLPSTRELWLAATGGLRLPWPWGHGGTEGRLAADPDYLDAPVPVATGAAPGGIGGSITGVLHVLGNAAEAAVGPGPDQRPVAAGGHFQSPAAALRLGDGAVPAEPLPDLHRPLPALGLRLAVPLPGVERWTREQARAEKDAFCSGEHQALWYRWDLQPDGSVVLEHDRSGTLRGVGGGGLSWGALQDGGVALPLPLSGWAVAQTSLPEVQDGHGVPCRVAWAAAPDGSHSARSHSLGAGGLVVAPAHPVRAGQRQRFTARVRLWPVQTLAAEGAGYTLRLPGAPLEPNAAVRHEVVLPEGVLLDQVSPASVERRWQDGRLHLSWTTAAMPHRSTTPPLHAHFRRGGMLAPEWPTRTEAVAAIAAWLAGPPDTGAPTLTRADGHPLAVALREQVLRPGLDGADPTDWLRDVTAVGPVWTCSVDVPLVVAGVEVAGWPLVVRLARERRAPGMAPRGAADGPLRVLGVAPRPAVDQGVLGADGIYRHGEIRVELRAPRGVVLEQLSDHALPLQVALRDPQHPEVRLEVLGHYAASGEPDHGVRLRLSGATAELADPMDFPGEAPGELLRRGGVGPVRRELLCFAVGDAVQAELWSFHRLGRRNLLLRAVATADSAQSAAHLLRRRMDWIRSVAQEVSLP